MDPEFLAILACPRCDERPPLTEEGDFLICSVCGFGYPVLDGIPHLLVEEAIAPDDLKERIHGSN
ncbi:MAG: Trm112 family protein [Armatimonadetes bacterium]|nr:Trm112 family protein [Armatimonadota bacterium]